MDNAIFEMEFLRKVLFAPTIGGSGTKNKVDWKSMETDLRDMDMLMVQETRRRSSKLSKAMVISFCRIHVRHALYPTDQQIYRNITDEQISILLELTTCYLLQCKSFEDDASVSQHLLDVLVILNVFLLASNKRQECEAWVREHLSELVSVRNARGDSILHQCMNEIEWMLINKLTLPMEPFVRLLVEEGKMDVNVVNTQRRETPLHVLSASHCYMERNESGLYPNMPTEDTMKIAQTLINNGAHMDAVNAFGREASWFFSQRFPQWSFNVNLKCLAAKAILKHGVRYEKRAAKVMIPFIESHKPKDT